MNVASEISLIHQAQAGDDRAFEVLYNLHAPRVNGVAWRMLGDRDAAADVTQEVFVRVWRRLHTFKGESPFGHWIMRITVNTAHEMIRAERRTHAREASTVPDTSFGDGSRAEDRIDLEGAIGLLPRGAREALVLHDIYGLKHEEVAELMGVTPGTVRGQVWRARQLLRGSLK